MFLFTEGWHYANAQERRTKPNWAKQIERLLEKQYSEVKKVALVMDNLSKHAIASLYEEFPPEKAFILASRLEIHFNPKYGSWFNIAEIELSALGRQCLGFRRKTKLAILRKELNPWYRERNMKQRSVNWQFTADEARIKLKKLSPVLTYMIRGTSTTG